MNDEIVDRSVTKGRSAGAGRSPNYPQMNIVQAIERIKKVYAEEHTHSVPDQSIAAALGYTSLNGTSKVVLSAMKKYGLLIASGDGFKVSQDAVSIIELLPDDPTRLVALHKSALRPPVFKQLYEKYGHDLPSDASLRHYLVSIGFESDAANQVIRYYKETQNFLVTQGSMRAENSESASEAETNKPTVTNLGAMAADASKAAPPLHSGPPSGTSQLRFQVSPDCVAEVSFTSQITQEAIRKLISYLELSMDVYPSQSLVRSTKANRKPLATNEHSYDESYMEDEAEE